MEPFDELLEIADRLLGPEGCPWDKKQTFQSLQTYVVEEAHELVEAVDGNNDQDIIEELGDLLYNIVFYGKLAEQTGRFTVNDIVNSIKEKLIRRHPHIFGDVQVSDADEVVKRWDAIKKAEKGSGVRKSAMDGIPPTLPALIRAQKIVKRIVKSKSPLLSQVSEGTATEKEIGEDLIQLALKAEHSGIDLEGALRRTLGQYEEEFRTWEENRIKL